MTDFHPYQSKPLRKGDVCAVRVRHSYDSKAEGHVTYDRWLLAYVTRASRAGIARELRLAGQGHSVAAGGFAYVHNIGADREAQARALADAMTYPGTEYETADALRAAILATAPARIAA